MHHALGAAIKLRGNSLCQRSDLRDAHLTFSFLRSLEELAPASGTCMPTRERFRTCEVPLSEGYFCDIRDRVPRARPRLRRRGVSIFCHPRSCIAKRRELDARSAVQGGGERGPLRAHITNRPGFASTWISSPAMRTALFRS